MGFFDKAVQAANELAGKAENALAQSGLNVPGTPGGEAAKTYQELGRLVHAEHRGEPADPARRTELLQRLDALAEQAAQAAAGPPPPGSMPPPPGATPPSPGSMPPPPGPGATPPPGPSATPPPPGPGTTPPPGPSATPPPPPPPTS